MSVVADNGVAAYDNADVLCLRAWWPWQSRRWAQLAGGLMAMRPLHKRCRDLIRHLNVPRPFDLELFKAELEEQRGRRIRFVPVKTGHRSPCGLWLATSDTDYVFFEASTSPLHQAHIALHELGHMLWGHQGISPYSEEFLRTAMPNLDPQALQRVLGRSTFSAAEEQEAEMFATVVGEKGAITDVAHREVELSPDTARMLSRLAAGLAEAESRW